MASFGILEWIPQKDPNTGSYYANSILFVLEILLKRFEGGPVSLDTLAVSVGEEADTIYDVYESFLIQIGFLARTSRGRIATKYAYEYMGMKPPITLQERQEQLKLFS